MPIAVTNKDIKLKLVCEICGKVEELSTKNFKKSTWKIINFSKNGNILKIEKVDVMDYFQKSKIAQLKIRTNKCYCNQECIMQEVSNQTLFLLKDTKIDKQIRILL